ncbi:MAG: beta-propeller fold lactonase family protein [Clostridia bacterium]
MRTEFLIGTYTTNTRAEGVYRAAAEGGRLTLDGLALRTNDPSYLLTDNRGQRLYWVDEALDHAEGMLLLGRKEAGTWQIAASVPTGGQHPCHLALSPDGRWMAVANYTSGSVAVYALEKDGTPRRVALFAGTGASVHPTRQKGPHAHFVSFQADELWCCDLGGDLLRRFARADDHWLELAPLLRFPAGCGPRHMVRVGELVYFVTELSAELYTYALPSGRLCSRVSCVPEGTSGTAAAIKLDCRGRLVISHRGGDCVSVFSLESPEQPTRVQTLACGGRDPRDLLPIADGLLCACQTGNVVTLLSTDQNGCYHLSDSLALPCPVCLIGIE